MLTKPRFAALHRTQRGTGAQHAAPSNGAKAIAFCKVNEDVSTEAGRSCFAIKQNKTKQIRKKGEKKY